MLIDIHALAKIPHLADVPLSKIDSITDVIESCEFVDGDTIIQEGEVDDGVYVVLAGQVEIVTKFSDMQHIIACHGPGEFFGLVSVIDNGPFFASARAKGKVRVGCFKRSDFYRLSRGEGEVALAFQRAIGAQLAKDFRGLNGQLQEEFSSAPQKEMVAPVVMAEPSQDTEVDCDVAVIGGGPLGMQYAQWIKRMRPESRVVQLERRLVPGYKVGESTLSTTVRSFLAMGFTMPQMRRLFGNKAAIRFWWAGQNSERPERECDITDLEETFQIERRVFEMALQRLTKEQGVDYRAGVHVELEDSVLEGDVKQLACTDAEGREYTLRTRFVCDATGPAAVLPRHLQVYRKEPELYDTFQTNCYFAYFRQKKPVPIERWQHPATRHLCTPQGWVWFISVHSWESADDETIEAMVNDVMDHKSADDADVPPRNHFAKKHGIDYEVITSIGITVRDDLDTAKDLPIQKRFEHYVERYPALAWILEHYELVEKPYKEKRRPHAAFLGLAHDSTQTAGKGWVAIGDSAQFTNPLFSHGINYGSGTAYMAAKDTVKALDQRNFSDSAFDNYRKYGAAIYPVLLHETDMYYRSWAHPTGFEKTLNLKLYFGALDVLQNDVYSDRDPYVFDLLNPKWIEIIDQVRTIEKRFEAERGDPEKMAEEISAVIDPFAARCIEEGKALDIDFNAVFTNFDGQDRRVQKKMDKPRAYFKAYQCATCELFQDDTLKACPVCGTANPAPFIQTGNMGDEKKPEAVATATAAPMSNPSAGTTAKTFHALKISQVTQETADATSFIFDVPASLRPAYEAYRPGQFVTVRVEVEGQTYKRAYSLSSAPSVDDKLKITVKRVEKGVVSNWMCDQLQPGAEIEVLPPSGRFTLPDQLPREVFLFAAGSGITAVYSIAKEVLSTSQSKVRLVYVNRTKEETIFADELEQLQKEYSRRFKVRHRLGRSQGRIDTRDVQAYCDEKTDGLYYMCGPWGFMDVVEEALLDMGVADDKIFVERFASPKSSTPAPAAKPVPEAPKDEGGRTVTLDVFGETHVIPYDGQSYITDAAAAAGVDAPCSCEEGFCGTCIARVVEGEVEMDVQDALSKGQKARGMILACQARALSKNLKVVFES